MSINDLVYKENADRQDRMEQAIYRECVKLGVKCKACGKKLLQKHGMYYCNGCGNWYDIALDRIANFKL